MADVTDLPTDDLTPADARRAAPASLSIRWRAVLFTLAALALALSLYLTLSNLGERRPLGCGDDSGCDQVMSTKWATLLGMPVSITAVLTYLVMMAGLVLVGATSAKQQRVGWGLLLVTASATLAAAIWFIFVQLQWIGAVCPYCMVSHGLGVALAALIFWKAPIGRGGLAGQADPRTSPRVAWSPGAAAGLVLLGVVGVGVVALVQALAPAPPEVLHRVQNVATGEDFQAGQDAERQIGVLGGTLSLTLGDEILLGSPQAPQVVAAMVDYNCPHCRHTHDLLLEVQAQRAGQAGPELAVVLLPVPLNPACNPHVNDLGERFAESCELARLALAVWRADANQYPAFDRWLFGQQPRPLDQARAKAAELVGQAALDQALADPWVDAKLERNVAAYGQSPVKLLPVLMSPGVDPIEGRVSEAEALESWLGEAVEAKIPDAGASE